MSRQRIISKVRAYTFVHFHFMLKLFFFCDSQYAWTSSPSMGQEYMHFSIYFCRRSVIHNLYSFCTSVLNTNIWSLVMASHRSCYNWKMLTTLTTQYCHAIDFQYYMQRLSQFQLPCVRKHEIYIWTIKSLRNWIINFIEGDGWLAKTWWAVNGSLVIL